MTDRDHFAAAALTGLLVHANDGIDEETLDTPSDIAYTAYAMADAMLRERERTNHDAAPAARAQVDAAGISRQGTGNPVEPEAWAVCTPGDGDWSPCFFHEPHAQRCASAIFGSKNIVPLYRSPTLTDAEREAIEVACQDLRHTEEVATLRGLLERLA